jgi:ssDNA-binding Zn-finger/Zn-ribbon topoisomerase 1
MKERYLKIAQPSNSEKLVKFTQEGSNIKTCPVCHSMMKLRVGRYGQFWGCSKYPHCTGTRQY